ncbi:MAG: AhpC/TSA family protein [Candidatus Sericytochromatia bacterium]|nr:AhpC/TSA family protein [Candidatus Sericytochromatia bacterium]
MRPFVTEIRQLGAELVVLGNGKPWQAAAFRDEESLDFPLLTDPGVATYQAAGLKRGIGTLLSLGVVGRGLQAVLAGHRQQRLQGDPVQQGGVFVMMPDGSVPYAYVSNEAGDHPPPEEILTVLRQQETVAP